MVLKLLSLAQIQLLFCPKAGYVFNRLGDLLLSLAVVSPSEDRVVYYRSTPQGRK